MRGTRPTVAAGTSVIWLPGSLGLLWVALQYLRYRIAYRGQWVVEVRHSDSQRSVRLQTVSNRTLALEVFKRTCEQVVTGFTSLSGQ